MDDYKFYIVAEKLYHYAWHELADKILEESKPILSGTDPVAKISRQQFLIYALSTILKLLHPIMPFVTEDIWSEMPLSKKNLLMVEQWPVKDNPQ